MKKLFAMAMFAVMVSLFGITGTSEASDIRNVISDYTEEKIGVVDMDSINVNLLDNGNGLVIAVDQNLGSGWHRGVYVHRLDTDYFRFTIDDTDMWSQVPLMANNRAAITFRFLIHTMNAELKKK